MMKIVGVISSPRTAGNTAVLVREVLEGAKDAGAEITEVFLPGYRIGYCQGCMSCLSQGDCAVSDDFHSVKALIEQADGIVLGSPTYAFAPNAILKTLIERFGMLERFTSSVFGGKYLIGISTCSTSGAKGVSRYIMRILANGLFQRSFVSGILGVRVTGGKSVSADPALLKKARKMGIKMASDIHRSNPYPLQNLPGRLSNSLMRPIFRGAIIRYKDDLMKGAYQNLHGRGLLG